MISSSLILDHSGSLSAPGWDQDCQPVELSFHLALIQFPSKPFSIAFFAVCEASFELPPVLIAGNQRNSVPNQLTQRAITFTVTLSSALLIIFSLKDLFSAWIM